MSEDPVSGRLTSGPPNPVFQKSGSRLNLFQSFPTEINGTFGAYVRPPPKHRLHRQPLHMGRLLSKLRRPLKHLKTFVKSTHLFFIHICTTTTP